jgi:hypothetical protein
MRWVDQLLEGIQTMHESTTYRRIINDGRLEEAQRLLLLELFQNNFSKSHSLAILSLQSHYTLVMANATVISSVRQKYQALTPFLHEKARRCWAACEALALGRGGISAVAAATKLSRPTIRRGIAELQGGDHSLGDAAPDHPRIRRPGGGRCSVVASDRTLLRDLQRLIDPATRGDPMSPLL